MRVFNARIIFMVLAVASFLCQPDQAAGESCIECHLHSSFVGESGIAGERPKTLAGFHGRELADKGPEPVCVGCHGSAEKMGGQPDSEACLQCHTRGKAAKGDPREEFHSERGHWSVEEISCAECHRGHVKGNPDIKFLTTDTIGVCRKCHEKSFDLGKPL